MKLAAGIVLPAAGLLAGAALAQAPGSKPGAPAAPQAVTAIPLGDPARWDYLAVDPGTHRLYVAHRERVDVIDTRSNATVQQLAPTPGVHGAAPAPELGRVFTSNGAENRVGVFDATTGKPIQAVGVGQGPDAIVYEPVTQRVFSFNGKSGDVTAIDAKSLKVLAESIPAAGRPEFAVADGHGRVYFNVEDKGEVAVLDAAALKIERHYKLGPCEEPSGLAIDPRGRLYSVCQNGWMVVSDPARGQVLGQAPIGHGPDGVAWMDGRAFSANGRDGTISVVAETAEGRFETVATLPTALGARTIAADPGLHVLFTATADFRAPPAAASAGDGKPGRPEPVAGTFRVLALKDPGVAGPGGSK
jgi:DNA-binding beta-propeller fold protein YncE